MQYIGYRYTSYNEESMPNTEEYVHVRTSRQTRRNLKMLAYLLEETMSGLVDRLVSEEAARRDVDIRATLKERAIDLGKGV